MTTMLVAIYVAIGCAIAITLCLDPEWEEDIAIAALVIFLWLPILALVFLMGLVLVPGWLVIKIARRMRLCRSKQSGGLPGRFAESERNQVSGDVLGNAGPPGGGSGG